MLIMHIIDGMRSESHCSWEDAFAQMEIWDGKHTDLPADMKIEMVLSRRIQWCGQEHQFFVQH